MNFRFGFPTKFRLSGKAEALGSVGAIGATRLQIVVGEAGEAIEATSSTVPRYCTRLLLTPAGPLFHRPSHNFTVDAQRGADVMKEATEHTVDRLKAQCESCRAYSMQYARAGSPPGDNNNAGARWDAHRIQGTSLNASKSVPDDALAVPESNAKPPHFLRPVPETNNPEHQQGRGEDEKLTPKQPG